MKEGEVAGVGEGKGVGEEELLDRECGVNQVRT